MKKYYFLIIVFALALLFIGGCNKKEEQGNYSVEELKQYAIDSIHAYEGEENDAGEIVYYIHIANDVNLPTANPDVKGSKITWTSLDETCIESSGKIVDRDSRRILNIDFECKVEYGGKALYIPFIF